MQPFKLIALLCALFISQLCTAQKKLSIQWGEELEQPKHTKIVTMLGTYNDKLYVLHVSTEKTGGQFVETYDKNNKFLSSSLITVDIEKGVDARFEGIMLVKGEITLFYTYYNSKQDKYYAFANKLGEDGRAIGKPFKIDEIQASKKKNKGSFSFLLSNDSTKVLVFRFEPYEKHANQEFNLKVLNNDLTTAWEKHVTMPFEDADVDITNGVVAKNGKVYLIAKFKHIKHMVESYNYFIYGYSANNEKPEEYEIGLGDTHISKIMFKMDNNENLLCAGYYDKSKYYFNNYNGTFFFKINTSKGEVVAKGAQDFPASFLSNYMSESAAAKGKTITEVYFRIDDVVDAGDGGYIIVGEDAAELANGPYSRLLNKAITAFKVKADGTFDWATIVPKDQDSKENTDDYYGSYAMFHYGTKLYFVYNDNPKNLEIMDYKKIKTESNFTSSVAVLATIDIKGKLSRQELFSNKESDLVLRPTLSIQSKANEIRICAQRRHNYKFGAIGFE